MLSKETIQMLIVLAIAVYALIFGRLPQILLGGCAGIMLLDLLKQLKGGKT